VNESSKSNDIFSEIPVHSGIYLGFQKGMVPSFKKGHLLAKKGTLLGRGDVFAICPKVNLWVFC
jgi:hypothetical protein